MKKIEPLADEELEFLKQLFASNVPITISAAHVVVSLKQKIERAEEIVAAGVSDAETKVGVALSDHLPGLGP